MLWYRRRGLVSQTEAQWHTTSGRPRNWEGTSNVATLEPGATASGRLIRHTWRYLRNGQGYCDQLPIFEEIESEFQ